MSSPRFCHDCGNRLTDESLRFCIQCGARVPQVEAAPGAPAPQGIDEAATVLGPPRPPPPASPPAVPPAPSGPRTPLPQPPPVGWPPGQPPTRPGTYPDRPAPRSRRGLFAALAAAAAVLAVVVVGGAYYLGTRGTDDTPASASASPTRTDGSRSEAASATTSPSSEPASTTPSPTAEPEVRDPLRLGIGLQNQACSGKYLILLQISGDATNRGVLRKTATAVSGAHYLENAASCRSFRAYDTRTSDSIYTVYQGPYPTLAAACEQLHRTGVNWARIKLLEGDAGERELCMCDASADELPAIGAAGVDVESEVAVRWIQEVQWVLMLKGYLDRHSVHGNYGSEFVDALAAFQSDVGQSPSGVVEPRTWSTLQQTFCAP